MCFSPFCIGIKFDLEADDIDANTIAGLLKQYLRELPSNLLTQRLQHVFDSLIGKSIVHLFSANICTLSGATDVQRKHDVVFD